MKLKLGAEPRKVAMLAILLGIAGYLVYSNLTTDDIPPQARTASDPPSVQPAPRAASSAPALPTPDVSRPLPRPGRLGQPRGSQEFRPSLKPMRPEDRPDPATIDPSLRLNLLAKLQNVTIEGGMRSLFEFSQPPVPKTPEPKILPKPVQPVNAAEAPKPDGNAAPPKPPPPPIPLKFYGYISPRGRQTSRRAFFLEGEEIHVAGEGDLIKKRYKVVRIGVNSVVVEDIEHKHQQTLPLEEAQG